MSHNDVSDEMAKMGATMASRMADADTNNTKQDRLALIRAKWDGINIGAPGSQMRTIQEDAMFLLCHIDELETALTVIGSPRRGTPEEHWDVQEIGDFARRVLDDSSVTEA